MRNNELDLLRRTRRIENDPESLTVNVDDIECYVQDNDVFSEFDYYC